MGLIVRLSFLVGAILASCGAYLSFLTARDPARNALTRFLGRYLRFYSSLPGVFFKSQFNQALFHGFLLLLLSIGLFIQFFFRL